MLDRRIRQANSLALSQEGLSIHALRLIYAVVAGLSPEQEQFATVEIPLVEMKSILQVAENNVYRDAKRVALELLNQTILIGDDDNGWKAFQWASESVYTPAKKHPKGYSAITIRLHENLKPYLLQLKSHFNSFPQRVLYETNSTHAFKLYQILWFESMAASRSAVEFKLSELKKRLNVQKKYSRFAEFNRFLKSLLEQVNALNSGMHVTAEKVGKPVYAIKFVIQPIEEVQRLKTEEEERLLKALKEFGYFNPENALNEYGFSRLSKAYEKVTEIIDEAKLHGKKPIQNPAGLLYSILQRGFDLEEAEPAIPKQTELIGLIDRISQDFEAALNDYCYALWLSLSEADQAEIYRAIMANANAVVRNQIERTGWDSRLGQSLIQRHLERQFNKQLPSHLKEIRAFALQGNYGHDGHLDEAIEVLEHTYS